MKLLDHVLKIRYQIERAFDNRFSRLGFKPEKVEPSENTDDERREHIGRIIAIHQKAGKDYVLARKEALGECVFTLFNRLAAIKVMETKELFPEVIRTRATNGNLSFRHNAWLEEHPEERNAERMGLKNFLRSIFSELAEDIPIFREDYPYDLLPTADELHDILESINAIDDDPDLGTVIWKGDDILGWQYENFNTAEKIALKESGDKIEYNKVTLQCQFYTPRWTVKFLVDNSLGKLYLEMYPDSPILELKNEDGSPRYLIANRPTKQMRERKPLTEIKVIDPACGSGNFLIYAFMLLYDMYVDQIENYGADYSRRDIPKLIIENNLYGVDLDERAAQLTQISLLIKAREVGGRRAHMPRYVNVVATHFTLPDYSEVESVFVNGRNWDQGQKKAIQTVWEDLRNAYKFGSLIRVEEKLNEMRPDYDSSNLFKGQDGEDKEFRADVLETIHELVSKSATLANDSYASRQVNDAIRFLNIISQSYDVAVANPPYTDSADFGPELKNFINDNYKKPYKVNINLYAAFIKRCLELTGADGKVAMINPPTFMYIKTFEDVRKLMIEETHISLFVEWGYLGLFSQSARVDCAFFCLDKSKSTKPATFIKLNDLYEMKRRGVLVDAYKSLCDGQQNDRVYTLPQQKLKEIKSWPFIYWISDEFREKFRKFSLEKLATVISGLKTGNNEATVRFWWEVTDAKKWSLMTKGGPYNKWYGNIWTKVITENNFELIKKQNSFSIPSKMNIEVITFPTSGSGKMSFRLIGPDVIFNNASNAISSDDNLFLLAILNSKLGAYALDCLNPTVNTTVGDVKRVPLMDFSTIDDIVKNIIRVNSKQNIELKKYLCQFSLIEPLLNIHLYCL